MSRLLRCISGLFCSVLCFVGCGGNGEGDRPYVEFFQASPDAPNLNIAMNGESKVTNLSYGERSPWIQLFQGGHSIDMTDATTGAPVLSGDFNFELDTAYLIVSAGMLDRIAPIITTVDFSRPPRDTSRIRVIHASPSAGNVDLYVVPTGEAIADIAPTASNVAFSSVSAYFLVNRGYYDVILTAAGTKTVAVEARNVELWNKSAFTIIAIDAPGGGAPQTLAFLDEQFIVQGRN
jgi:hypothetical protein